MKGRRVAETNGGGLKSSNVGRNYLQREKLRATNGEKRFNI